MPGILARTLLVLGLFVPLALAALRDVAPADAQSPSPTPNFTYTRQIMEQRQQATQQRRAAGPFAGPFAPSSTSNMTYHGGPVMQTVSAYTIFWTPNNTISSGFQTLVNRYFQDINGSAFYNINTQYSQTSPAANMQNVSTLGGTTVDTTAYPGSPARGTATNPLTDQDIRDAVQRALTNNAGWNPPGLTRQYLVFTEPGIESCFNATNCTPGTTAGTYCAYHFTFQLSGNDVIYANMPYAETWTTTCRGFATSPNGNLAADAEISIASHEHFEAATDPLLNAWYDSDISGENGDKCAYNYGTTQTDGHNMVLNGNRYIIQQEWSNAALTTVPSSGCVTRYNANVDVSVSKTVTPSTIVAGNNLTYTIAVANSNATFEATDLQLTDTLPTGTTFQSLTPAAGWSCTPPAVNSPGTLTCTRLSLPANSTATFTLVVKVTSAPSGSLANTAAVTSTSGDANAANNSSTATATVTRATTLTYTGDTTQDYHDSASLKAKLTDTLSGAPIAGKTINFTLGSQTGSGTTDSSGEASTNIVINQAPGSVSTVGASFAGDAQYVLSSTSAAFTITREETTLAYTGDTLIANGGTAHLTAVLKEDGTTPIAGRTIAFTLGTGASAQTCTGTTDGTGTATCNVSPVAQPLGPGTVSASFAGDTYYLPASASGNTILFAFLDRGSFVVGDQSATGTVTYWDQQWASRNSLGGSSAPPSFKGFAGILSATPPTCTSATAWSTRTGNSPPPPAPDNLPSYMAVLVASSATQSGSTVSGNTPSIAIVRTNPGYAPNPQSTGTGTVVAVLCHP